MKWPYLEKEIFSQMCGLERGYIFEAYLQIVLLQYSESGTKYGFC